MCIAVTWMLGVKWCRGVNIARLKVIRVLVELESVEEAMYKIEKLGEKIGDEDVSEAMRRARSIVRMAREEVKKRLGLEHL